MSNSTQNPNQPQKGANAQAQQGQRVDTTSPITIDTVASNAIQRFVAEVQQNSWSFAAFLVANTLVLSALIEKIDAQSKLVIPDSIFITGTLFGLAITILWALTYHASTIMHDHTLRRVEEFDKTVAPPIPVRRRYALGSLIAAFFLAYIFLFVFWILQR